MDLFTSNKTNVWATPEKLFQELNDEFNFTLDPCCTIENARCEKFFTEIEDGLIQDWSNDIVFMNPPYGRQIIHWMRKAYKESLRGATVVCLVFSKTETQWWHRYAMKGEIRFIEGRLKFGGSINNAPFGSAIVIFRAK